MAIPFKSLRYQPGIDQTWGINLRRVVRWKNEWSYLAQVPRALTTFRGILKISSAGTLEGLQVPSASRNLELKPYALADVATDNTVSPAIANDGNGAGRRRPEVRHHPEHHRRPHRQHRLLAGRGRRTAGQPDPLQPVLPGEARLLPRGPRHLRVCRARQRRLGRRHRRHAVPVLQPPHWPRSVARDPAARRRPRHRQGRQVHLRRHQRADRRRRDGRASSRPTSPCCAPSATSCGAAASAACSRTARPRPAASAPTTATASTRRCRSTRTSASTPISPPPGPRAASGDNLSYRGFFDYNADKYGVQAERLVVEPNFLPEIGFVRRTDMRRNFGQLRYSSRPAAPATSAA